MRKLALGVLISLIPYVGMVWMLGWEMEYQRNVAWGDDECIPGWSDFAGQALLGLKAYVAILPYSLVLSVIMVPALMAGPLLGGMAADSGAVPAWLGVIAGFAASSLAVMALSLLIVPFTSSAMLRVALYGTLESGLQFKEIWRLMREHQTELLRAWGFSVINTGISLAVMILYLGSLVLLLASMPGSWEQKFLTVSLLGFIGFLGYVLLAMPLSLYLGLANMHLFGSYGRAAYNLDAALQTSGAPSAQ